MMGGGYANGWRTNERYASGYADGWYANATSATGWTGYGTRDRGPAAPQRRTSAGSGSPVTSVQQRGPQPSIGQQNSNALLNARNFKGA